MFVYDVACVNLLWRENQRERERERDRQREIEGKSKRGREESNGESSERERETERDFISSYIFILSGKNIPLNFILPPNLKIWKAPH